MQISEETMKAFFELLKESNFLHIPKVTTFSETEFRKTNDCLIIFNYLDELESYLKDYDITYPSLIRTVIIGSISGGFRAIMIEKFKNLTQDECENYTFKDYRSYFLDFYIDNAMRIQIMKDYYALEMPENGRISEYAKKFAVKSLLVKYLHPGFLTNQDVIDKFIDGLYDELNCQMRRSKPKTYQEAYSVAVSIDKSINVEKKKAMKSNYHYNSNQRNYNHNRGNNNKFESLDDNYNNNGYNYGRNRPRYSRNNYSN